MKFVGSILQKVVIFLLVAVVFNITLVPVYENVWVGLAVSAGLYTLTIMIVGWFVMLIPVALFGTLFALFDEDTKDGALVGGCLGIVVAIPLIVVVNAVLLHYGHAVVDFFPVFTWGQALLLVVLDTTIAVIFNLENYTNTKGNKSDDA